MSYWQDKVVLVTGGSAGLGRVIAQAFVSAGSKVVIAARGAQRLTAAADEMRSRGGDVTDIAADVTDAAQVETLLARTIERHGRLDVMVNNAGRSHRGRVSETTPEQFRELLELNFLALVRCTQAALPQLLQSRGHLVNIGSLAAKTVGPHLGAYPASKFPVAAYSQQLRLELAPQGVHVLLVCPGPIARDDAGGRYDVAAQDLPETARKPGGGVKVKAVDPQWLTQRILTACQRRRPELIVPGKARLLMSISQLWPSLGDWIIRKMT